MSTSTSRRFEAFRGVSRRFEAFRGVSRRFEAFRDDLKQKFHDAFGERIFNDMAKTTGREFDRSSITGEIEIYRRSSPWHDFEGNKHSEPFDPLNP